jgi:ribosomal protein L40E
VVTSALRTKLVVSVQSFSCSQNDRIAFNATLLDEEGAPLVGQVVEVHILDLISRRWQIVGSNTTGQQGQISLETKVAHAAGTHEARFLYSGGKIGKDWYASAIAAFELNVAAVPATEITSTGEVIPNELPNIVPVLIFSLVIIALIVTPVTYLRRRSRAKPTSRAVIADEASVRSQQIQLKTNDETESARAELGSVKFCHECGARIPVRYKFCNRCGTRQAPL